ncbi:MAG: hypothetical protein OZ921_14775 [Sorangiineae bacterium]|nr:hypothetical protein [Polyangiaceae bacterium]MEB2323773.1 hypothetical protein [Sorangiineae bacterium]
MVKRLVVGLVKGLVTGAVVAALLVFAMHLTTFGGAVFAYATAAVTGVLVGFVAGRPIWQHGARIEAGLKAFAGALLGAGAMFALRRWLPVELDLASLGVGKGLLGELPAVSLPLVATALAVIFELDNTGDDGAEPKRAAKDAPRARVSAGSQGSALDELEADEPRESRARRRG